MKRRLLIGVGLLAAPWMVWAMGCSTAAPPAPAPAPVPITFAPAPPPPPPAEWNVFPNFLTGRIDIYHNGSYYGSISADQPGNPPVPKKVPNHSGSLD